ESIYGGEVAAPVFRRVARRWAGTFPEVVDRMTAEATTSPPTAIEDLRPSPPAPQTRTVPSFEGLSTRRALHWLRRHGVDVQVEGRGLVADQRPRAGTPLPDRMLLEGAP
ncbi:MAG: penicillin-binding protein, partial [Salinibacter sp.]